MKKSMASLPLYLEAMIELGRMKADGDSGTDTFYGPTVDFKPMSDEEISQFCPAAASLSPDVLQAERPLYFLIKDDTAAWEDFRLPLADLLKQFLDSEDYDQIMFHDARGWSCEKSKAAGTPYIEIQDQHFASAT